MINCAHPPTDKSAQAIVVHLYRHKLENMSTYTTDKYITTIAIIYPIISTLR